MSHGMPISLSFIVCLCLYVVTVLTWDHTVCSLSASLPSGISVFLAALLGFNNTPSTEASRPWITTAVVLVFVSVIVKHVWSRKDRIYLFVFFSVECVYGFASSHAFLLSSVLIWEQACSLGLWGGVLSADFVWLEAWGSYWSIVSGTHHIYLQLIGCVHGRQPQPNREKSYINMLVTSF